jgi:hypothetical protein
MKKAFLLLSTEFHMCRWYTTFDIDLSSALAQIAINGSCAAEDQDPYMSICGLVKVLHQITCTY